MTSILPRPRLLSICLALVLASSTPIAFGRGPAAESPRVLTSVAEIRQLSYEEAAKGLPVKVRGVIMYRDPWQFMNFLHDGSNGIYIEPVRMAPNEVDTLHAGMLVEVTGRTMPGGFAPSIDIDAKYKVLANADFPTPLYPQRNMLIDPKFDSQWIEIEAAVTSMELDGLRLRLKLSIDGRIIDAFVSGDWKNRELPKDLINSDIRVRGVFGSLFNKQRQLYGMTLFVPNIDQIEVIDTGYARAFAQPPVPVTDVMGFKTRCHRVRVKGVVLASIPGEGLFVRADSGAIRVHTLVETKLLIGQKVDVAGVPTTGGVRPFLQHAAVRAGSIGNLPFPVELDSSNVTDVKLHGELVRLEARVVDHFIRAYDSMIVLEGQGGNIHVRVPHGGPSLKASSWVAITGICMLEPLPGSVPPSAIVDPEAVPVSENPSSVVSANYSVNLIVRSEEDIKVLQLPSWWTAARVTSLIVILSLIALSTVMWGFLLRRKIREQTLLIESKVHREKIAEERARIAGELHDSLEQELVGITMQLDSAASRLDTSPDRARESLDRARAMLRHSQAETRRSVWDLRAPIVTGTELTETLEELASQMRQPDGPVITVSVAPGLGLMTGRSANHLFRIAQEAVTNSIKHSGATKINIDLREEDGSLRLNVADNGIGFDMACSPSIADGHFGVSGMRERAAKLQGTLQVDRGSDAGTAIMLSVPTPAMQ